jgi:hypothetical protein
MDWIIRLLNAKRIVLDGSNTDCCRPSCVKCVNDMILVSAPVSTLARSSEQWDNEK